MVFVRFFGEDYGQLQLTCAKHHFSINDPITDFLLVTAEDFSKFKEQPLLFGPSATPPMPTANFSITTNPSYQPEALLKKEIKRDATLFNTLKENKYWDS